MPILFDFYISPSDSGKGEKEKRKATARANAVERDFCARTDMERVAGILYFLFRKYIPLCTARLSQRLVSYTHDR